MKIVLDTSIIISMLLSPQKYTSTRLILQMQQDKKITLTLCKETLVELKETISDEKFKKQKRYNSRLIGQFLNMYQHTCMKYNLHEVKVPKIRDKNDNIFLQLALISKANYLITGDKDLLEVKKVGKTRILKPAEFLKEYKNN